MVDFKVIKKALQTSKAGKAIKQGDQQSEKRESDLGIEEIKLTILNAVSVENEKSISKYTGMILEFIYCSPRTPV